ncbi:hypothetical protein MHI12_17825 [Paenibacillus sp. FSL H8-0280]|uniref:hypothetical protein n=1 Tax=Paenibacillus sp. FSL H8-0280 TaxID=2921382 RepID=UPI0032525937
MKKKLLAGLLAVSACFSVGSTSFAADATISTPNSSPSEMSQVIAPHAFFERDIYLKVGQPGQWYSGYTYDVIYSDGACDIGPDFLVTPIQPGLTVVSANHGTYTILFKFHVSY